MTFELLPAVDVAAGQAVRLVQGQAGSGTVHGDPAEAALDWQAGGAKWVHLVDLDAAFKRGSNAELLTSVIGALDIKVQLSGGIYDDDSLNRALSTDCERVVVSTGALDNSDWCMAAIAEHGDRVAVALDVRVDRNADGTSYQLAGRGWPTEGNELWPMLALLEEAGCARYVITDVSKDGTLGGPNMKLYRDVDAAAKAPVIVSGGISSIDNLVLLATEQAQGANIEGAVVGKAFYAGRFTLPEALEAVRPGRSEPRT